MDPPMNDVPTFADIHVEAESATSRGRQHVRNEDACHIDIEGGLFAVADGMGGHRDGHVASGTLIAALSAGSNPMASFEDRIDMATMAIETANRGLYEEHLATPGSDIIGSTVLVLVLGDQHACCLWVGDSRLYLFRNQWLYLLSEDHAENGALIRAVGSAASVQVDRRILECHDGDIFLLCSDGLLKGIGEDEVAELLARKEDLLAERLIAKAIAGGSNDDITVILVRIDSYGQ
jgi:serine/threonine protein phosphatase PrpC